MDEYFTRNRIDANVLDLSGYSGYFRISYRIPEPAPLVSLLVPTRDRLDLLKRCVDSILDKTTYPNYEIIVLDNDSSERETLEYFEKIQAEPRVRVIRWPHPFHYSTINHFGAGHARGEVNGLLKTHTEVIPPGWRPEDGRIGEERAREVSSR